MRPLRSGQGALCPYRRQHSLLRGPERREESVPLRPDLSTVLRFEGLPHDLGVKILDRSVVIAELLEESRVALDVGEQERDRSRRQVGHAWPP